MGLSCVLPVLQLFLNKIWIYHKHLVSLYNKLKEIVMETIELTTKRGLTYELGIESYSNSKTKTHFGLLAICAEGAEAFFIVVPNYGHEFDQENDDLSEVFSAMDLTRVELWVDSVMSSEIARLANEVCVNNTTDENYWSFSIYTLNVVRVSVIVFGEGTKTVVADYSATGYDDIVDMLIKLKK